MKVAVLGAAGRSGRAVIARLDADQDRRHEVSPLGRTSGPARADAVGSVHEAARRGAQVLVQCAPLSARAAAEVAFACASEGLHYLDVTAEAAVVQAVCDHAGPTALRRGVTSCCAVAPVGGALGLTLAGLVEADAHAVAIAYVSAAFSPAAGSRRSARRILRARQPCVPRWVDFAPPYGRGLAVRVPFADAWLLHRLHGRRRVGSRAALVARPDAGPELGFGLVVQGLDARGRVVQEMALSCSDPYELTGVLVAGAVRRLGEDPPSGFVSPASLVPPAAMVNDLAGHPTLRWFRGRTEGVAA